MRDVLYYEKARAQLQETRRQTKIPEYRAELSKAIRFAARRINQIKYGVLVTVVLLAVLVAGCCTAKGVLDDISWSAGRLAGNIQTEQPKRQPPPQQSRYWSTEK